ncbi:MAG: hypothetical protein A2252_05770 [Elusimicrobia bacterium RIFOXYA2_FULL_39_19]|nr:MAG: hypothetical protein A2252_05770 [Elusimicrobia bacterium RIFOXYA2_FULL_39_19]
MNRKQFKIICIIFSILAGINISGYCQTYVPGTLNGANHWTVAGSPYIVDVYPVLPLGATLTIDPGVIVKFANNNQLLIKGVLTAQGTEENPIVFTSDDDPSYGSTGTGAPGQWDCLYFSGVGIKNSIMDHCIVKYGGSDSNGQVYVKESLDSTGESEIQILNCTITNSSSAGIQLRITSATISNCNITNNVTGVYAVTMFQGLLKSNTISNNTNWGIRADSSLCVITNNTISSNYEGIHLEGSAFNPNIIGNTITANTSYGISSSLSSANINENIVTNHINSYPFYQYNDSYPKYYNNTVTGNTYTGISVWCDDPFVGVGNGKWVNASIPYVITPKGFRVKAGATFEIDPGTVIKFNETGNPGQSFEINGVLNAQGTETNPITFTSWHDDSADGIDTDGNGASVGSPAQWRGVVFSGNSVDGSIMNHCIVKYGGYGGGKQVEIANTVVTDKTGEVTVSNCNVSNGFGGGILLNTSKATVSNCTVENNAVGGSAGTAGISCEMFGGTISQNTIKSNGGDGGIRLWNSNCTISNNVLQNNNNGINILGHGSPLISDNNINSNYNGIYFAASSAIIKENEIKSNNIGLCAYYNPSANITYSQTIENNDISGNINFGMTNSITSNIPTINAENNWWGDLLGPKHINNPDYLRTAGDKVSDNITFYPWIGASLPVDDLSAQINWVQQSITLSWTNPSDDIKEYQIAYMPLVPVTADNWSLATLLPNSIVPGAKDEPETYTVQGLTFDKNYYFVLKTVGKYGNVSEISNNAVADTLPPELTIINLKENDVIGRPIEITASATDESGISKVEFYLGNTIKYTATQAANGTTYGWYWNTLLENNGVYDIKIIAYDTYNNTVTKTVRATINYTSPPAPKITFPQNNHASGSQLITVSGTAEANLSVKLYTNDEYIKSVVSNGLGEYSFSDVSLIEGNNYIKTLAYDTKGQSQFSNIVNVLLDLTAPVKVDTLEGQQQEGGKVLLTWNQPAGEIPAYYNIYRADRLFTTKNESGVSKIAGNVTTINYTDTAPSDGVWYYAVTGIDAGGTESEISNVIEVASDAAAPSAVVEVLSPAPLGTGVHTVNLTVTEILSIVPILNLVPISGPVIPVLLNSTTDPLIWTGELTIQPGTASGNSVFQFEGKDFLNNTGTQITSGKNINIDTQGPSASITINPQSPVKAGLVTVTVNTNEPVSQAPELFFNVLGNTPVPVILTGSQANWSGTFTITEGTNGEGTFDFSGVDLKNNIGTTISSGKTFQIDTTAPSQPLVPTAISQKGGTIRITWTYPFNESVPTIERFILYRDNIVIQQNITSNLTSDTPAADGQYSYTVTAVDKAGNEGAHSATFTGVSDRTAPNIPENLTGAQTGTQILLNWNPPSSGETPAKYNIYRADHIITSISGLTPIVQTLDPTYSDSPAADAVWYYVVTSLDSLDNEGAPSQTASVSFSAAPPKITVTGVTNNGFYKTDVTPLVTITDLNLDTYNIKVDEIPTESGVPITAEGSHKLSVYAIDQTGYSSTLKLNFTIDKTLPVVAITNILENQLFETSLTPAYQVSDLNACAVSLLLNNQPLAANTAINKDGDYTLKVTATDSAGNAGEAVTHFKIDTPPAIPENFTITIKPGYGAEIVWAKSAETDLKGYNIYCDNIKLNIMPVTANTFTDVHFTDGKKVTYKLIALDKLNHESQPVETAVIPATFELSAPSLMLTKKYFDNLELKITNLDTSAHSFGPAAVDLYDTYNNHIYTSNAPAININGSCYGHSSAVLAIPSWYAGTTGTLKTYLYLPSSPGTTVRRYAKFDIKTQNPIEPIADIYVNDIIKNKTGHVTIQFFNRGSAPIDILTKYNNAPVEDITIYLKDYAGRILAQNTVAQDDDTTINNIEPYRSYSIAKINGNSSFLFAPIPLQIPVNVPENVVIEVKIKNTYYNYDTQNPVAGSDFNVSKFITSTQFPYNITAQTDKPAYEEGQDVIISGQVIDNATGLPVTQVTPINLKLYVRNAEQLYKINSDSSGNYTYTYRLLKGESGIYGVSAVHPDQLTSEIDTSFHVYGMDFEPIMINMKMVRTIPNQVGIKLNNFGENPISNINLTLSQPVPTPEVTANVNVSHIDTLNPGKKDILLTFNSTADAPDNATFELTAAGVVTEGATTIPITRKTIINLSFIVPEPVISFDPLQVSINKGETDTRKVVIENTGYAEIKNAVVSITNPAWVTLINSPQLGNLQPGTSVQFALSITPGTEINYGDYFGNLKVSADNLPEESIPTLFRVTASFTGKAMVVVTDQNSGVPIAGAEVKLINQDIENLAFTQTTDINGTARFDNIHTSLYNVIVTRQGYTSKAVSAEFIPGTSYTDNVINLPLPPEFITFDWVVEPTTITDEYEVTLNMTYETGTVQPTLIPEPGVVNIYFYNPEVAESKQFMFKLTNTGNVSAFGITTSCEYDGFIKSKPIQELKPNESALVSVAFRKDNVPIPKSVINYKTIEINGWFYPVDHNNYTKTAPINSKIFAIIYIAGRNASGIQEPDRATYTRNGINGLSINMATFKKNGFSGFGIDNVAGVTCNSVKISQYQETMFLNQPLRVRADGQPRIPAGTYKWSVTPADFGTFSNNTSNEPLFTALKTGTGLIEVEYKSSLNGTNALSYDMKEITVNGESGVAISFPQGNIVPQYEEIPMDITLKINHPEPVTISVSDPNKALIRTEAGAPNPQVQLEGMVVGVPVRMYVQGLAPSAELDDILIRATGSDLAKETITVTKKDMLNIENVPDADKYSEGGFVCENQDDDNNNNIIDSADLPTTTSNENDLLKVTIFPAQPRNSIDTIKLECTAGSENIRVWKENKLSGNPVSLPATFTNAELPETLYIEGLSKSNLKGVELKATAFKGQAEVFIDSAKLTVFDLKIYYHNDTSVLNERAYYPFVGDSVRAKAIITTADHAYSDESLSNDGNWYCLGAEGSLAPDPSRGFEDQVKLAPELYPNILYYSDLKFFKTDISVYFSAYLRRASINLGNSNRSYSYISEDPSYLYVYTDPEDWHFNPICIRNDSEYTGDYEGGGYRYRVRITKGAQEFDAPSNEYATRISFLNDSFDRQGSTQQQAFVRWATAYLGQSWENAGGWFGGKISVSDGGQGGYQGYGLDCSGLVSCAAKWAGYSWAQSLDYDVWKLNVDGIKNHSDAVRYVSATDNDIIPGDLLIAVGHVLMVLKINANGTVDYIEAVGSNDDVKYQSVRTKSNYSLYQLYQAGYIPRRLRQ